MIVSYANNINEIIDTELDSLKRKVFSIANLLEAIKISVTVIAIRIKLAIAREVVGGFLIIIFILRTFFNIVIYGG